MAEYDVNEDVTARIEAHARRMRRNVAEMSLSVGMQSSHVGGGLSIIDITATLYCEVMNLDQKVLNLMYFLREAHRLCIFNMHPCVFACI